jgi:hypothetical protein
MTTRLHPACLSFTLLAVAGLLSACGGGDDPAAGGSSGKYAGTWASACTDLSSALGRPNSYKSTFVITSPDATKYTATGGNTEWANATCTGTGAPIAGESGSTTFTLVGTKTVGSDTVDKVTAPGAGTTTLKNISFVSADGRSLRLGGSGTPDADGYPTVLNATVYTTQ